MMGATPARDVVKPRRPKVRQNELASIAGAKIKRFVCIVFARSQFCLATQRRIVTLSGGTRRRRGWATHFPVQLAAA